jgi:DNA-binding LacI/PurR family transcriptional regulator
MARLLDAGSRPDAVFAFNDLIAIGVLRCCYDRGIRVPEDVAVVGFDDLEEGRYTVPSLSTISPDKDLIGRTAVRLLAERLAATGPSGRRGATVPHPPAADGAGARGAGAGGDQFQARELVVPHRLEVRESTAGRGKR